MVLRMLWLAIAPALASAAAQTRKPPMGFINPFLYQNAAAFTDITVGDNAERGPGWKCAVGWDAVTGLGTPIFPKLLAAAMAAA